MKESYAESLATHSGPESYGVPREGCAASIIFAGVEGVKDPSVTDSLNFCHQ